ncbi:MAG: energy-coupling factor ABC transporter substrate-binding protein [Clostridia bacterium]|nr:energy-coupling factor ABC transporter substrate-binding protein [Clostridia bacterium]
MRSKVIINLLLVAIVVILAVAPLYIMKDAEFGGADAEAEKAITKIKADYEPWFSPIFEPKSGEVESLLFALQAAIGAGIIGYGFGYLRGRRRKQDEGAA